MSDPSCIVIPAPGLDNHPLTIAAPAPQDIPAQEPLQHQLFVDADTLAQVHALAVARDDSSKKVVLLEIILGFKANPLGIGEYSIFSPLSPSHFPQLLFT